MGLEDRLGECWWCSVMDLGSWGFWLQQDGVWLVIGSDGGWLEERERGGGEVVRRRARQVVGQ